MKPTTSVEPKVWIDLSVSERDVLKEQARMLSDDIDIVAGSTLYRIADRFDSGRRPAASPGLTLTELNIKAGRIHAARLRDRSKKVVGAIASVDLQHAADWIEAVLARATPAEAELTAAEGE